MIITLVPVRMDSTLTLIREGETLIINGERVDLSAAAEGAPLDLSQRDEAGDVVVPHPWIIGPVERREGGCVCRCCCPMGGGAGGGALSAPFCWRRTAPSPCPAGRRRRGTVLRST
ncbi:hypothetical protein ruthe_02105 [Rubellimicrobium thermophilum DSM 16684]|uniref:Uncharacterized protein n=1 Tax=Rubellimicrobium thermophilum DSM 16684 TaxID=1123069 RepID=S9S306_9RHOB|nr:hypothetical protein [Rubellimicrobium thermophilum]EPX84560.1 hypothetical protein ruthe_02105 [Rubellimicrobium thermophilum DSM 16684]